MEVTEVKVESDEVKKIPVYFRNDDKSLGRIDAAESDHRDAILLVQEELIAEGTGFNNPVLALIQGGKQ